jgi:hypothetical protein
VGKEKRTGEDQYNKVTSDSEGQDGGHRKLARLGTLRSGSSALLQGCSGPFKDRVLAEPGNVNNRKLTSLFLPFPTFGLVSIHLCKFLAAAAHSALCCRSPEVAKHANRVVSSGVHGTTICSVKMNAGQARLVYRAWLLQKLACVPLRGRTLNRTIFTESNGVLVSDSNGDAPK